MCPKSMWRVTWTEIRAGPKALWRVTGRINRNGIVIDSEWRNISSCIIRKILKQSCASSVVLPAPQNHSSPDDANTIICMMMLSHSTRSFKLQASSFKPRYCSNANLVLVDPRLVTMHHLYSVFRPYLYILWYIVSKSALYIYENLNIT